MSIKLENLRTKGRGGGPAGGLVRYGEHGRAKYIRTSGARWSDEAEESFLDALAATCNVAASAEEVGFSTVAVYRRKRLDAGFAAKWEAALAQGFSRLEMALVQSAADSMEGVAFDADRSIPRMTVAEAMNLLKLHRAAVRGEGHQFGRQARPRSLEELREGIVRKIEAIRNAPED